MEGKAVNVIEFSARGLNFLSGQLMIEASFNIVSNSVKPLVFSFTIHAYVFLSFTLFSHFSVMILPSDYDLICFKNRELI